MQWARQNLRPKIVLSEWLSSQRSTQLARWLTFGKSHTHTKLINSFIQITFFGKAWHGVCTRSHVGRSNKHFVLECKCYGRFFLLQKWRQTHVFASVRFINTTHNNLPWSSKISIKVINCKRHPIRHNFMLCMQKNFHITPIII